MRKISRILVRNRQPVYRTEIKQAPTQNLSSGIRPPDILTTQNLVQFLILLNDRRGFRMERSFNSFLREAKHLLDDYDSEQVKEAMLKAASVANHPFGINFVRRVLSEG